MVLLSGTHKRVVGLFAYADVDECAEQNGGCHDERECINTEGGMRCEDCSAGWVNDGAKGCLGERLDCETRHGELICSCQNGTH